VNNQLLTFPKIFTKLFKKKGGYSLSFGKRGDPLQNLLGYYINFFTRPFVTKQMADEVNENF
jgi:hypothetical protein